MNNPSVLGRSADDDANFAPDPRAESLLVTSIVLPFQGGANGTVRLSLFKSAGSEDRGGIVIRVVIEDHGQSFIPHAVNIENGVELHIAGQIEASKVLTALKMLISLADSNK